MASRTWPVWPLWVIGVLSVLVALVSYRLLLPGMPGVSPDVTGNHFNRYGLLAIHAGFAATALLLGPFQFVRRIRARWPRAHRWSGTAYVISCLAGGLAGLGLAPGSTAGPIAQLGFGSLAVLWLFTTGRAWLAAHGRRFGEHEQWMIRSFALTLAAVTLRLYLPIAPLLGYDFMPAYRIISFAAWVPNLIVAELLIRRWFPKTSPLP